MRPDARASLAPAAVFPQLALPQRLVKRLLDLSLAIPALLLLSPVFLLLAALIKRDSRGPVFFRQERVGQDGRIFRIFKFRTMIVNAEQQGKQLTVGLDSRITRSGQWLRRAKFDELPQLLNILRGEMSLVGPRPEVPRYVALYATHEKPILALKPGLTSLASLQFRDENTLLAGQADPEKFYLEEVLPTKLRTDLAYAQRATALSDLRIIAQTLVRILR
jgi:lipopolysaccharide/colanic/teichoic acid biosynthesis glycosyltransferase